MAPRRGLVRRLISRAPTFTETFIRAQPVFANAGGVFTTRIDDIPQLAQYSNLYRQYKINWVKFTLLPQHNSYDGNTPLVNQALPRITWAVNTTPDVAGPVNEPDLLQDNGVKIRTLGNMWSQSIKPTPNLAMTDVAGGVVPVRTSRSMFLNFTAAGVPNPVHYGISYWISQQLGGGVDPGQFFLTVKINFSLRDPQ